MGTHFGLHGIHEYLPDGLVSDRLIFASQKNAGVRVCPTLDRPAEKYI